MSGIRCLAVLLPIVFLGYSNALHAEEVQVEIETESGLVRGEVVDGVRRFRGIPYAEPPVGDLRWAPPQNATPWSSTRDALEFGPSCAAPQSYVGEVGTKSGEGWDLILTPMRDGTSEDCLTLNVWSPPVARDAPVMVFMSSVGEGSLPYWDGSAFARDGVVLITFNNRMWTLDSFPHPALRNRGSGSGATPPSFGKLDRLKVLEWIQHNVRAFGGDPSNVTIFGQSAGGRYVLEMMTTPETEGLYHKAIVQSCCAWSPSFSLSDAEQAAIESLNFAGLNGSQITAEELRQLDPGKLPIVVGLLREDLFSGDSSEMLIDVPLLIGGTDWDGSSLRRTTPEAIIEATPQKVLNAYATEIESLSKSELGYAIYTDEHVNAPARWLAREISRRNTSHVYRYIFSYVVSLRKGQQGAAHTDDVPFAFDSWNRIFESMGISPQLSDVDLAVTSMMHECWVTFARNGIPSCGNLSAWPPFTPEYDVLVDIGSTTTIRENYRKPQYDAVESWVMESWPKTIDVAEIMRALRKVEGTK